MVWGVSKPPQYPHAGDVGGVAGAAVKKFRQRAGIENDM